MECPICGADIPWQAEKCRQCGLFLVPVYEDELRISETLVLDHPDDPSGWISYANDLSRLKQTAKAIEALDRALPLLSGSCLSLYRRAASNYVLANRAQFGTQLLADGLLYHLENYRGELDPDDIQAAADTLRRAAKRAAIDKFNAMSKADRGATRSWHEMTYRVGFDDNPRPDLDPLGAFELANELASPPGQRLYPGLPMMQAEYRRKLDRDKALRKYGIRAAVVAVVLLLAIFLCSQCGATYPMLG